MEPTNERYEELAEKWLNGTITPEEQAEFARWYEDLPGEPLNIPASFAASEAVHRRRIWRKIAPAKRRTRYPIAVAASVLMLMTAVFLLRRHHTPIQPASTISSGTASKTDHHVVLTLSDGHQIVLGETTAGQSIQQPGTTVTQTDTGMLRYAGHGQTAQQTVYNELTTPKGVVFRLQLSDGTLVWLNAATTLRYPTAFNDSVRSVFLNGQAYFEVAANAHHPFIVHSGPVVVKALGTAFDVMSYTDEDAIRTTLTQGRVSVSSDKTSMEMAPGEQVSLANGDSRLQRTEADLQEVLAWKDGRFRFSNTNIKTVMRQIARWYDVSVEYGGPVTQVNLTGSVSRKERVESLLKALEVTGGVHFALVDHKITVIPP